VAYIPAYTGEFGLKILHHVPHVYALGRGHTIEIEAGEEALYPLADRWDIIPRVPETADKFRHHRPKLSGLTKHAERFVPVPFVAQDVGNPSIVIAPRKRNYVPAKNWPHFQALVDAFRSTGFDVFAGGVADASDTDLDCDAAWHYDRPLDATIAAMHKAAIVVAPCSGLAHLAVLCGRPLLLFTDGDRVSPGPVYTSSGRKVSDRGNLLKWTDYYVKPNHTNAPLARVDGWHDWRKVYRAARALAWAVSE
jgi:hypothetical protein